MRRSDSQHYKRHCMVVFSIYPLGETRVQREAEILVRNGYEVDVVCVRLPGEVAVTNYKGVNIYREKNRLPGFLLRGNGLNKKFLKYLRFFISASLKVTCLHIKKHYGCIQVHNLPDYLVFCTLIPRLLGVPVVLDLHDLMPEFYAGRFGQSNSLTFRLINWQEQLACKYASHVITVSEHWRQALKQRGVPAEKCSVIMNVADETIFCSHDSGKYHQITRGSLRLVYHGSFHKRYGLDLAIKAVDRVRHEIPNIHLTLIGVGDCLPSMIELIDSLGLKEYVTVMKLQLAEKLPELICSNDIGIVPYHNDIFTDGLLPTKLMEYAALGMPAIASRTTAIESYFKDTMVELFEPGSLDDLVRCIFTLYNNPERLIELSRGCEKFNQKYNWTNIGKEYVHLIDSLNGFKGQ